MPEPKRKKARKLPVKAKPAAPKKPSAPVPDSKKMQRPKQAEEFKGKSMELGGGGRFAKLEAKLESQGKSEESAKAIAASVGRKSLGNEKFQAIAAAGKKRKAS